MIDDIWWWSHGNQGHSYHKYALPFLFNKRASRKAQNRVPNMDATCWRRNSTRNSVAIKGKDTLTLWWCPSPIIHLESTIPFAFLQSEEWKDVLERVLLILHLPLPRHHCHSPASPATRRCFQSMYCKSGKKNHRHQLGMELSRKRGCPITLKFASMGRKDNAGLESGVSTYIYRRNSVRVTLPYCHAPPIICPLLP